jgi:hypothetical protein
MFAMGVAYSSPDSPFTQLCAVYVCPCGAAVSEVGRRAGELPPGWERLSEGVCACARCSARWREEAAATKVGSPA